MSLLARVLSKRECMIATDMAQSKKSAAKRPKRAKKRALASVEPKPMQVLVVDKPSPKRNEVTALQALVIQGLARGLLITDLAQKYQHHLVPHEPNRQKRLKKARTRIRHWMSTQKMRDLLWQETMIGLDLATPAIVNGVKRKAAAGRIDAARLALELTGRHAPHAEVQPAQINIQFGDIPRPRRSLEYSTDGPDAEVEDADWEPA